MYIYIHRIISKEHIFTWSFGDLCEESFYLHDSNPFSNLAFRSWGFGFCQNMHGTFAFFLDRDKPGLDTQAKWRQRPSYNLPITPMKSQGGCHRFYHKLLPRGVLVWKDVEKWLFSTIVMLSYPPIIIPCRSWWNSIQNPYHFGISTVININHHWPPLTTTNHQQSQYRNFHHFSSQPFLVLSRPAFQVARHSFQHTSAGRWGWPPAVTGRAGSCYWPRCRGLSKLMLKNSMVTIGECYYRIFS